MVTVFETETMAELYVKQGLVDRAVDIFGRLAAESSDPAERRRYEARVAQLPRETDTAPMEVPGLRVKEKSGEIEIEWRLPPDVQSPTLQLLLLRRTPAGIETDPRTLPLATSQGRTVLGVTDLCGVRAAAGRLEGQAFVPLVRFPDRIT